MNAKKFIGYALLFGPPVVLAGILFLSMLWSHPVLTIGTFLSVGTGLFLVNQDSDDV